MKQKQYFYKGGGGGFGEIIGSWIENKAVKMFFWKQDDLVDDDSDFFVSSRLNVNETFCEDILHFYSLFIFLL